MKNHTYTVRKSYFGQHNSDPIWFGALQQYPNATTHHICHCDHNVSALHTIILKGFFLGCRFGSASAEDQRFRQYKATLC